LAQRPHGLQPRPSASDPSLVNLDDVEREDDSVSSDEEQRALELGHARRARLALSSLETLRRAKPKPKGEEDCEHLAW